MGVGASASLTGLLDGGLTKAIDPDAADPVAAIDTLDFSARGAAVSVNLALATAGGIAAFSRIDSIVGSSLAGDTLTGPDVGEVLDPATAAPAVLSPGTRVLVTDGTGSEAIYEYIGEELTDGNPSITGDQPFNLAIQDYSDPALWKLVDDHVNWNITGANAGEVEGTAFSSFENLTGRGASSDYFLFGAAGSLSGTLAGGVQAGSDTADGFAVFNATTNTTDVFQATTPEQSGTIVLAGKTIVYTGMDPAEFIEGDNAERQIRERAREQKRAANQVLVQTATPLETVPDMCYQAIVIDPPWDWGDEGDADQLEPGPTSGTSVVPGRVSSSIQSVCRCRRRAPRVRASHCTIAR